MNRRPTRAEIANLKYNREREERYLERTLKNDLATAQRLENLITETIEDCRLTIEAWHTRYASTEGISMAEAKMRAATADIEDLARKARYYVQNKDIEHIAFSRDANREMRLYNLSMKTSRLELLMTRLELILSEMSDQSIEILDRHLIDAAIDKMIHQAGFMALSIPSQEYLQMTAETIARESFHGQRFSDRIWQNQDLLMEQLKKGINSSILSGRNPLTWHNNLRDALSDAGGNASYNMRRLAMTETARVQVEVQNQAIKASGYDHYMVICKQDERLCDICRPHDEEVYPIDKLSKGSNAPPWHPNCRCSIVPHMTRESLDEILNS